MWSGKPTMAANSKGTFPRLRATASTSACHPLRTYQSDVETVHRLEEDEFFDYEDFSSRGNSAPKSLATSCTSIWRSRTSTRKISVSGKPSSGSLPVRPPNSACFQQSAWITTSTTQGIRCAQASHVISFYDCALASCIGKIALTCSRQDPVGAFSGSLHQPNQNAERDCALS
jgi:hypothetical protein